MGLSPEFEIALYTILYLCGGQKNQIEFGNIRLNIEVYKMQREGRNVLATLFPSL